MAIFTAAVAVFTAITSTAVGAAIVNFAVRTIATYVISSLLVRKQDTSAVSAPPPIRNRTTVNADTANKLPVVYGDAFMGGIIIDAKISEDQQYMWYVMALSEVTDTGTITFDDPNNPGYPLVYWGDKQMVIDATDRTKVTGLKDLNDPSEPVDTKVNGLINVYFYNNGVSNALYGAPNAVTVLSDGSTGGGIPLNQRWDSDYKMNNTAFMVLRIKFDQDANLTGSQPTTVLVRNSLNKPGSVIYDYLTNERYGCGIPTSAIDLDSLTGVTGLNAYSDDLIPYTDNGVSKTQARYRVNGPVYTSESCMENLIQLTESCDSWLQWNEQKGKWGVIVNRSYEQEGKAITDLFTIYSDTVIADSSGTQTATNYAYVLSGVDITPVDLNETYNRIEVSFPNKQFKDQQDQVYIETPSNLLNPNEPINQLSMQLPLVNDNVQAQYIANRRLEQARDDLIVTLTVDYGGIQVDAGDVVRVYHEMYGWTANQGFTYGKLFRVTQVQEIKDEDGNLSARLTLSEYNDQVYDNFTIDAFTPARNTGITDPTVISTPNAPTTSNSITAAAVPSFQLTVTAPSPSLGQVTALEFWYALASSPPANTAQFKLYETQFYSTGAVYPRNYSETITVTGLPASGTGQQYYFRVRAVGNRSKSSFSANSTGFTWLPAPTATVVGQNFQTVYQPSPVTVAPFANNVPDIANVTFGLYGLSGAEQVDYANVSANVDMPNNSWRIDIPNIVYTGTTFSSGPVESNTGTYAVWNAGTMSSLTSNVATVTTPVIYKDNSGNLYQAPPAVLNITKTIAGQTGSRGVVTLAYVPVNYNPTYGNAQATDANLTASFFATTGFNPPIDNDGAVFFNTTTGVSSSRVFSNAGTPYKWTPAVIQVPGQVITSNSISNTQIVINSITGDRIANNAVGSNNIAANSITADKITANSITTDKLQANSITTDKLAAQSITTDKLAANITLTGNLASFNANIGNFESDGFWFDSANGTARIGNSLSVGLLIESSQLRANTVTAENLVIGSVTQSRSTISSPEIKPIAYTVSTPAYTYPWPSYTRGIVPDDGVTIIPTTDPTSSANVEFTEGSRLEIGFTAKVWVDSTYANGQPNGNDAYNLIEVWKTGASTYFAKGLNSIKHAYNQTANVNYFGTQSNQTIHAVGFGGEDLYSTDGGVTWQLYPNIDSPTQKALTGQIPQYFEESSNIHLQTAAVGLYQEADVVTNPLSYSVRAKRFINLVAPTLRYPLVLNGPIFVAPGPFGPWSTKIQSDLYDMCVAPYSGGNGAGYPGSGSASDSNNRSGAFAVGGQGTIIFLPSAAGSTNLLGDDSNWTIESSGTLQTLNAIYANRENGSKQYTVITVGSTGTIAKSDRVWGLSSFPWSLKLVNGLNGQRIITDLYDVASDDTQQASNTKWVAVGQYGVLLISEDNGESWTQVDVGTKENLNGVKYCNGTWVVVGDKGTFLYSTNLVNWFEHDVKYGSGVSVERDLQCIDYSYVWDKFNIGGQGGIIVNGTALGTTITTSVRRTDSVSASYNLTRLTFYGSNPLVADNSAGSKAQQLVNGQTVSGTIIDTDYAAGQPVTYYLVVGNMKGGDGVQAYAGQIFLNVTEVKR